MARYENTPMGFTGNKNTYGTTIYVKVPEKDTDQYFIAQEGDRCDILAFNFYGTPHLWWFIARVNNLKTMNIPAGTSLRIPSDASRARGF